MYVENLIFKNTKKLKKIPDIFFKYNDYIIYSYNIKQKQQNNLKINLLELKYNFINFGYNNNILCFIYENNKNFNLVVFDMNKIEKIKDINLNDYININNYKDFIFLDNRIFIKKIFGNLSFLKLNQNTNSIFIYKTNIIIFNLNRTIFLLININNDLIEKISLENLIHKISQFHLNLNNKFNFFDNNNNIISNNINNILYMNTNNFKYGINFYNYIYENEIYFIFFIQDDKIKKNIFVIYNILFFPSLIYIMKNTFEINYQQNQFNKKIIKNFYFKWNKKNNKIVISLNFEENYFEIILIDINLKTIKILNSLILLNKKDKIQKFNIITDIFFNENNNKNNQYCLIILDFINLIIINLNNYDFILFQNNNNYTFYLNLNDVFKFDYNKILFSKLNIKNDKIYIFINTKKNIKLIRFKLLKIAINNKINFFSFNGVQNEIMNNNVEFLKYISKTFENNLNIFYYYLYLFSKINKNSLVLIKEIIPIINKIQNQFLYSENNNLINVDLNNYNFQFGIFGNFLVYSFNCLKINDFINENLLFTNFFNLTTKKLLLEDENEITILNNKENELNIYEINFYNFSNNKKMFTILLKELLIPKFDLKKFIIIIKKFFSKKEEQKIILNNIKFLLIELYNKNKKINNIEKIENEIYLYEEKYYILQLFYSLIKKNNNIVLKIFNLLNNYFDKKEFQKIINFILDITFDFYLNYYKNNKNIQFIYNEFYINDIILYLEKNKTYNFIKKKYFIKKISKNLFNDKNNNIKFILCFISLILQKFILIQEFRHLLNSQEIIIFINIINYFKLNYLTDQNKMKIKNNLFKSENYNSSSMNKIYLNNIIFCEIIKLFKNSDYYKKGNIILFYYIYNQILIPSSSNVFKEEIIIDFFDILLNKIKTYSNNIVNKFISLPFYNFKYKQPLIYNNLNFFNDLIIKQDYPKFINEEIDKLFEDLYDNLNKNIFILVFIFKKMVNKKDTKIINLILQTSINQNINEKLIILINKIKDLILNCFYIYNIFNAINIINKKFIENLNDDSILISSLLKISFFYKIKNPEKKNFMNKEIFDYICDYLLINENSELNIKISNNLSNYADFDIGGISEEKIEKIKKKIKIIKKDKDIFYYIKKNDLEFDFFIKEFFDLYKDVQKQNDIYNKYLKNYPNFLNNLNNQTENVFIEIKNIINLDKIININFNNNDNNLNEIYKITEKEKNKFEENINDLINLKKSSLYIIKNKINKDKIIPIDNKVFPYLNYFSLNSSLNENENNEKTIENFNSVYSNKNLEVNSKLNESFNSKINDNKNIEINENEINLNINSNNENNQDSYSFKNKNLTQKITKKLSIIPKNKLLNKNIFHSASIKNNKNFIKNKLNEINENELKCKYLSLKLLNNYYYKKIFYTKQNVFKFLKAKFFINYNNIISSKITINLTNK